MKKTILLFTSILLTTTLSAQWWMADFESPDFAADDSAWFGQDQLTAGDTTYENESWHFELNYDDTWGSFSGWSVSSWTDDTTPGWINQFSSITGAGADGSDQYGVCYVTEWTNNRVFFKYEGTPEEVGMGDAQITNTTYAYYSMLNGDSFAKKFGEDTSATGVVDGTNGEDWFLLTIYGLGLDSMKTGDSVNFYLADYRFADDSEDYIVDDWEWISLTDLGTIHGLEFVLSSSDTTGGFGMNTPAYFAMDNLGGGWGSISEQEARTLKAYPNPTSGTVWIELNEEADIEILNMQGQVVWQSENLNGPVEIDLNHLSPGMYNLIARLENSILQERIIKQ